MSFLRAEIPRGQLAEFSLGGRLVINSLPPQVGAGVTYTIQDRFGYSHKFTAGRNAIYIRHTDDAFSQNQLCAVADRYNQIIRFRIYTRECDQGPKDEIYEPNLFYRAAFSYLIEMGNPIAHIGAEWTKGETNYRQYNAGLAQGLTPTDAALSTWSGRKAANKQYRRVDFVTDSSAEQPGYLLIFTRK